MHARPRGRLWLPYRQRQPGLHVRHVAQDDREARGREAGRSGLHHGHLLQPEDEEATAQSDARGDHAGRGRENDWRSLEQRQGPRVRIVQVRVQELSLDEVLFQVDRYVAPWLLSKVNYFNEYLNV
jgi:hypothetical protein